MTTTASQIQEAFEAARPALTAEFTTAVRAIIAQVRSHHEKDITRGSSCWSCAANMPTVWATHSHETSSSFSPFVLDEDRLTTYVAKAVDATLEAFTAKVQAKTEGMDSAELTWVTGTTGFEIVGRKNGHRVEIAQRMILNVSSRGKIFNQFPARVRIDGKGASEKALLAL